MSGQFDHEKLEVYQLSLRFVSWVSVLFDDLAQKPCRRVAEVCDHLDRASLSILFNTAEGNGKRQNTDYQQVRRNPSTEDDDEDEDEQQESTNNFLQQMFYGPYQN